MELENLTDKEIQDRIDTLRKPHQEVYLKVQPLQMELNRRKAERLLETKYFIDTSFSSNRYIKVLSAKGGEFGIQDVRVDFVVLMTGTTRGVYMMCNAEELNHTWTCELPITREVYEGALERASEMLGGMFP